MNYDFVFTNEETNFLKGLFSLVKINPYSNYWEFYQSIKSLFESNDLRKKLTKFAEFSIRAQKNVYVYLKNCPLDEAIPNLSFRNLVESKRRKKTTYIAESFLLLYAIAFEQTPIGYINVNNGDIFQDIHPKESLQDTQSQKALNSIYFHKDLANHFVRPDWVNILALRNHSANRVFTSFSLNQDVIKTLSKSAIIELEKPQFYTPFDDLTVIDGKKDVGMAAIHPIIGGTGEYDIRFFENRTIGLGLTAQKAVYELCRALHLNKQRILLMPGDFIGSENNSCLHCKEVLEVAEPAELKRRWLMKTVNVSSLDKHREFILDTDSRRVIING